MDYEQRLKLSRLAASAVLFVNAGLCLAGADEPKASAGRALLYFGLVVFVLGLVLCWSKLHGTGRSIRMAMFLVMGIAITAIMTIGLDVFIGGIFIAALLVTLLSIQRNTDRKN